MAWPGSTAGAEDLFAVPELEFRYTLRGYMKIRAAGHYYQRVFHLAQSRALDTETLRIR